MTSGGPYLAGQLVRVATYSGTVAVPVGGFRDAANALIDPATVKLGYTDPNGATTTLAYPTGIIKDATGLYHYDIDTTGKPGLWLYEWYSPAQTIAAAWFEVRRDPIAEA